jgi:hypothetical protein
MAPQKKQKRRDRVRNKQPKEGRGRGEEGGPEEGVRLGSWPRTVRASPVAVGGWRNWRRLRILGGCVEVLEVVTFAGCGFATGG